MDKIWIYKLVYLLIKKANHPYAPPSNKYGDILLQKSQPI
jgi:hypothetical protein